MAGEDLEMRSKELVEKAKKFDNPFAVPLNVISELIGELGANKKLKSIYGANVLEGIGLVAVGNDLRIIDLNEKNLGDEQKKELTKELQQVIRNRSSKKG